MATIQVTALALSNSARVHSRELTPHMRASIMRLRRPIFLPSITDAPQEVDARGGRGFADLLYSRTNSAGTAASQDFALHDEIGSRAWWLLLVGLLARCCCCCWSGRCCRCRCGRRGAASRCWLVQLGAMGAWVAVGSAANDEEPPPFPWRIWIGGRAAGCRHHGRRDKGSCSCSYRTHASPEPMAAPCRKPLPLL